MFALLLIASKHVSSPMEKIVGTHAVCTVTTRHVTDLMEDAPNVVQTDSMENCVIKVHHKGFRFLLN